MNWIRICTTADFGNVFFVLFSQVTEASSIALYKTARVVCSARILGGTNHLACSLQNDVTQKGGRVWRKVRSFSLEVIFARSLKMRSWRRLVHQDTLHIHRLCFRFTGGFFLAYL